MKRSLCLLALLAFSALFSQMEIRKAVAQDPRWLKNWRAGDEAVKKLGDVQAFGGVKIRIPKTFEPQPIAAKTPKGTLANLWAEMDSHGDQSSNIVLTIITPKPGSRIRGTLDQSVQGVIAGAKSKSSDFKVKKVDYGAINGMSFGRVNWSCYSKEKNVTLTGSMYCALDNDRMIMVAVATTEEQAKIAIPVLEASALSLVVR